MMPTEILPVDVKADADSCSSASLFMSSNSLSDEAESNGDDSNNIYSCCACPQCGKTFMNDSLLMEHATRDHAGFAKFLDAGGVDSWRDAVHVSSTSGGSKNGTGGKSRSSKRTYGNYRYGCKLCPRTFASSSMLNVHYTHTHRDKPQYDCEVCGRAFSVKRELATHRRLHDGQPTHRCAQCHKEFGTKQLLRKHELWHTGERSHVCPQCSKAFFQKGHLTQHLMIHAGGRNHACHLCPKTFIFKFDLNRHMKIHAERVHSATTDNDVGESQPAHDEIGVGHNSATSTPCTSVLDGLASCQVAPDSGQNGHAVVASAFDEMKVQPPPLLPFVDPTTIASNAFGGVNFANFYRNTFAHLFLNGGDAAAASSHVATMKHLQAVNLQTFLMPLLQKIAFGKQQELVATPTPTNGQSRTDLCCSGDHPQNDVQPILPVSTSCDRPYLAVDVEHNVNDSTIIPAQDSSCKGMPDDDSSTKLCVDFRPCANGDTNSVAHHDHPRSVEAANGTDQKSPDVTAKDDDGLAPDPAPSTCTCTEDVEQHQRPQPESSSPRGPLFCGSCRLYRAKLLCTQRRVGQLQGLLLRRHSEIETLRSNVLHIGRMADCLSKTCHDYETLWRSADGHISGRLMQLLDSMR